MKFHPDFCLDWQSCLRLREQGDLEVYRTNPAYQTKNALPSRSNSNRVPNGIKIKMGNQNVHYIDYLHQTPVKYKRRSINKVLYVTHTLKYTPLQS